MKKNNILNLVSILLITILLHSCKDQISQNEKGKSSSRTVISTPVDSGSQINWGEDTSEIDFKGILQVVELKKDSFKIIWQSIDRAANYAVFYKKTNEEKWNHQATVNKNQVNYVLKKLDINTAYHVKVILLDDQGKIKGNKNIKKVITLSNQAYANKKSISFEGNNSVKLNDSDYYFYQDRFTVSLWFKTNAKQSNSTLLSLAHHRLKNRVLKLMVKGSKLYLNYRDVHNKNKNIKFKSNLKVTDNNWHHIVLYYQGNYFKAYLDSNEELSVVDTFYGLGQSPAFVGSEDGSNSNFNGLIDEVALIQGPLTLAQVQEIYNQGKSTNLKGASFVSRLKSWYRFGDDSLDSEFKITDVVSRIDGTPCNMTLNQYKNEGP